MKSLVVERSVPRFAAARVAALLVGSGRGVGIGPLRLADLNEPESLGDSWHHVAPALSGICGSDLATLNGESSRYFESIVTFPFVLGHEIVGKVLSGPHINRRVVVEPVLGCETRGIEPLCAACASGQKGRCDQIAFGHLQPGLQTGFCNETGGGWSERLIVHDSQIHLVPDEMSDEQAVMVEPSACAIHAVYQARINPGERVVVLGAGTLGLLTIAALRYFALPASLVAVAKHTVQRELADQFGADIVAKPSEIGRAVRRTTGSLALTSSQGKITRLAGGADVIFDCVGSSASITEALSVVRPGGRIVLVGMPAQVRVDLAPLWQREIRLMGTYAYGTEDTAQGQRSTFDLAFELVAAHHLEHLVSAHYPLERYEEAINHAANAGSRGAVKVVFDLRREHAGSPREEFS